MLNEKYDVIRLIRGKLWIQHRFWIGVNSIFRDSGEQAPQFLSMFDLFFSLTLNLFVRLLVTPFFCVLNYCSNKLWCFGATGT